jgi:sec-independent protein translocase protein TatA
VDFFGMGVGEIALILIVALIVFGPGKLPEIARTLGKFSRNMKKMSTDLTTAVNREINVLEEQQETAASPRPQKAPLSPAGASAPTPNAAQKTVPAEKPLSTTEDKHD